MSQRQRQLSALLSESLAQGCGIEVGAGHPKGLHSLEVALRLVGKSDARGGVPLLD